MVIVAVEVGVAHSRPPRLDSLSRVLVDEPCADIEGMPVAERRAEWVAIRMASKRPGVVMAVWSRIVDVLEV